MDGTFRNYVYNHETTCLIGTVDSGIKNKEVGNREFKQSFKQNVTKVSLLLSTIAKKSKRLFKNNVQTINMAV